MAAFHVFVDGSIDDSPMGLKDLANAIASHYGLNAAELLPRLQKGRFRVKTNADEATAAAYKRDLEKLGAICTIEEANAINSQRTPPAGLPTVKPTTPEGLGAAGATTPPPNRPATSPTGLGAAGTTIPPANTPVTGLAAAGTTTPPANRANTPASGLAAAGTTIPPANTPASGLAAAGTTTPPANRANTPASGLAAAGTTMPPANRPAPPSALAAAGPSPSTPPPMGGAQFQSGLSAAFSGEMPAADLGALGELSVSSLDGVDDKPNTPGSFTPPGGGGLPASIGPAPEKKDAKGAKGAKDPKDKPKDEPLDMFAPPDMQGDEFKVDIAADEADFARKRASTPPPMATVNDGPPPPEKASSQKIPATPPPRKSQPSLQVPNEPVTTVPSKLGPLGDERVRFAAGVLLAVLLGFVPAHFVAKMKEESATEAVDRKVIAAQQTADTPELYATLDRMRADQLDRKKTEHRNAAFIGFAVWALVGGGIAFAWFKKIPWDG